MGGATITKYGNNPITALFAVLEDMEQAYPTLLSPTDICVGTPDRKVWEVFEVVQTGEYGEIFSVRKKDKQEITGGTAQAMRIGGFIEASKNKDELKQIEKQWIAIGGMRK